MNRREKAAFTGWPPVLIFSKKREKEKWVCVCMCVVERDRQGGKEKE